MRLWHEKLIPVLSNQRLLGQHRECCALRGNGWGRKHATVDYVFTHPYYDLFLYHLKVMTEMDKRNLHVDDKWRSAYYRGKQCKKLDPLSNEECKRFLIKYMDHYHTIYPEHDKSYLNLCIKLLEERNDKGGIYEIY